MLLSATAANVRVGVGRAPAHHGELLQGMFDDTEGRLRRGLVTLPCPPRGSRAEFRPSHSHWGIVGTPDRTLVRRAAILALARFSTSPAPAKGGTIEIISDVPHGIGMGSSTADVAATLRAVADYHGMTLPGEEVGRLAVLAECASDSIMIDDQVVLFGHREGVVLESLGHRLPRMVVVGCDTAPGTGGVATLGHRPAEYDDRELGMFQVLRGALRRAVATGDVPLLGRVATASARINQRFLPKPVLDDLIELCRRHGGHGVQIAHSGTVAGLIFDSDTAESTDVVPKTVAGLEALGCVTTAIIDTDATPAEPTVTETVTA